MAVALCHTEIVDGKAGVNLGGDGLAKGTKLVYLGVIYDNGIEVDGDDTTEYIVHITLHFIDLLVCDVDVGIRRDLRMEGDNKSANAVIVHHNIMDAEDVLIALRELIDLLHKLGVGRRAKEQVDGFLCIKVLFYLLLCTSLFLF